MFGTLVMEPGSLVMGRKMLLCIKERAENLAREQAAVVSVIADGDAVTRRVDYRAGSRMYPDLLRSPGHDRNDDPAPTPASCDQISRSACVGVSRDARAGSQEEPLRATRH